MEVMLDIKNVPKVINPTVDSVIVFDGKTWYLTSKESLLKEAYDLVTAANETLANLKQEHEKFKNDVNSQLKIMSSIIQDLYKEQK